MAADAVGEGVRGAFGASDGAGSETADEESDHLRCADCRVAPVRLCLGPDATRPLNTFTAAAGRKPLHRICPVRSPNIVRHTH